MTLGMKRASAENYAVVIGYTSSKDLPPPPSPGLATKLPDAYNVQEGLKMLGWKQENLQVRDNEFDADGNPKPDGSDPTKQKVIDDLNWLLSMNGKADVVLFHYAGHTDSRENSKEADGWDEGIVLTDGTLWDDEFTEIIKEFCGKSKAVIIQVDACWAEGLIDDPENVIKQCPNMHFGFSSTEDRTSTSHPTTALQGHAYTYYKWVEGFGYDLDENWQPKKTVVADKNEDGKVTVEELEGYATTRVKNRTQNQQQPGSYDGNLQEEIPLCAFAGVDDFFHHTP
jgi:hypothetical protein